MSAWTSREKTELCGACFDCWRGARELISEKRVRAPVPSTIVKNVHAYSTRNGKLQRLEPHFQFSATRSGWKVTETAVALRHSRECAKEPISALPNNTSMEKSGARAKLRNILQEKSRGRGGSSSRFYRIFGIFFFFVAMQHRWIRRLAANWRGRGRRRPPV